ncbi:hypothetical protein [Pseudanabaena sp. BC1403]|uniref:hypothetical protein n=1 Tax=Pseudanabaena sp. BC1403 TaxID=2043171 RepID=UPI000CD9D9EE|nr:hypothetical protein [Pseudanabaena sp. BC1403]
MSSSDWRLQPLRSFWQSVNWENRAIAPITSNNGKGSPPLSLLMSVREYFRAISWTGIPEIAATSAEPKPSINSIDASNETLEDFLDDISQFF